MPLTEIRRHFADELRYAAALTSADVVEAFAKVPREAFLGPGPWRIPAARAAHQMTLNDDPRHLYHNVLVAIDPKRGLNNGLPSFLAFKIQSASIQPTDRVVHIGCGVGYYSAVMGELAASVTAIEADPDLARRSRENLAPWTNVDVVEANGALYDAGPADVIFVNAGATHPMPLWLDRLAKDGRMILPLTHRAEKTMRGIVLLVEKTDGFRATAISAISVYDCEGARDDAANAALGMALDRGRVQEIRSLRAIDHDVADSCWAHVGTKCISTLT